eukprot:CAMPEP_0168380844 /NCGR_PEP_ID=MMETSP0228-20121227/12570_1 /TAXON_ID=133427 /ORGANISM="Protoceratium reticulatum, Strain CCCM 535 (=CCMP 1889)" /LENGTH=241 /DNA_ID=CAMNT_0008393923 /DNA_START=42 /DNA_END=768 /DNA_ORIENTATION=+
MESAQQYISCLLSDGRVETPVKNTFIHFNFGLENAGEAQAQSAKMRRSASDPIDLDEKNQAQQSSLSSLPLVLPQKIDLHHVSASEDASSTRSHDMAGSVSGEAGRGGLQRRGPGPDPRLSGGRRPQRAAVQAMRVELETWRLRQGQELHLLPPLRGGRAEEAEEGPHRCAQGAEGREAPYGWGRRELGRLEQRLLRLKDVICTVAAAGADAAAAAAAAAADPQADNTADSGHWSKAGTSV